MSPRAACRLESLGFRAVYDYVPGKSDWLARGLPTEGTQAATRRAHDLARADVVRAVLTDPVEVVAEHLADSAYPFALVVSEQGTLLGRLPRSIIERSAGKEAGEVMEAGPSTVRADTDAAKLLERLRAQNLRFGLVTTPEGKLVGVVRRDDL